MLPSVEITLIEYVEEEVFTLNLISYAKSINGGKNIDEDDIDEWFNCGINYPGFEHLTDKQIVGRVLGTISNSEEKNGKVQYAVKQMSHEATLRYINRLIQYRKN